MRHLMQAYSHISSYNHFRNILGPLLFYQIFLSPQVKRCAIITCKHGVYDLLVKKRLNFIEW